MDDLFFFIQARSTSTRLPEKVIQNFHETRTILDVLIDRLKSIFFYNKIVLLIPEFDIPLKKFCLERNYSFFLGSENDVRQRYIDAARFYNAKKIVRLTGDNPFIDREHLELLIEGILFGNFACISFKDLPLGMGAEAFTREALEWEPRNGLLPHHREHVSLHIKENPDLFPVIKLKPLLNKHQIENARKIRVTIDEKPDMILCQKLYKEFLEHPFFGVFEVLELFERKPDFFSLNANVTQIKFQIQENEDLNKRTICILYGGRDFGSGHRERMKYLYVYLQILGYSVFFTEISRETPEADIYIFDARDEKLSDTLLKKKVLLIDNMGTTRKHFPYFDTLPHPSLPFLETAENTLIPKLANLFKNTPVPKKKQILLYTGSLKKEEVQILEKFLASYFPKYSIYQIGEYGTGSVGVHLGRLSKFEFFSFLSSSEIFVSYFGLGVLEAEYIGAQILIYSISDYHQELSNHFCSFSSARNLGPLENLQFSIEKPDAKKWTPRGFEKLINKIISLLLFLFFIGFLSVHSEEIGESLEPKNTEAAKIKIDILKYTQEGQLLLKQGKSKEVPAIAQKIKSLSETSPESYYLSGSYKYINNEYKSAISDLEIGLKANPNHDPSIFLMGLIYVKMNKYELALLFFERACKEAPYNPFYRLNTALLSYINGNYTKAKIEAEQAIKLKENYTKAKFILAFSLYKIGKKTESFALTRELYEKKVELDDIQLLYLKLLLEESKNYDEIIQILARKNKLNIEEKRLLGHAFMEEGLYLKSIQFFRMVIDSGLDTEEDNLGYLRSLIMIGKSEEAEKLFIELNKKNFKDKKVYIETYYNTFEMKSFLKHLYQPFPV